MKDRLIEIVKESLIRHIDKTCKLAENITDDLIANGVIFPLVRVGQKVWYLQHNINEVCEATITRIEYNYFTSPQDWVEIDYISSLIGTHTYKSRIDLMLGKNLFFTKAEAEAALAGRSKE